METINISTLSETLKDGHPEKTHANYSTYGVSIKSRTYFDTESNQMYLVTVDLKNDDILNIQKVER
jgi:hypothetical protein